MKKSMIIVNGKKSGLPEFREAVHQFRSKGHAIDVRVTWEYGDCHRFVSEAVTSSCHHVIAAGGDGTVNEVSDALAKSPEHRLSLGIIPMGTANDFAVGCHIPLNVPDALELALSGETTPIDLIKVGDRHFINIASAGFGAKVTSETPVALKNLLGGGAYILMGIIRFANFVPYKTTIRTSDETFDCEAIVGAVCNGRQTGSGQVLGPNAFLNDGLMDVLVASAFPAEELPTVIKEAESPSPDGKFIRYFQCSWLEGMSDERIPLNLDGEPFEDEASRFEVVPSVIEIVLPGDCPCIKRGK